jgi:hypothetical protein
MPLYFETRSCRPAVGDANPSPLRPAVRDACPSTLSNAILARTIRSPSLTFLDVEECATAFYGFANNRMLPTSGTKALAGLSARTLSQVPYQKVLEKLVQGLTKVFSFFAGKYSLFTRGIQLNVPGLQFRLPPLPSLPAAAPEYQSQCHRKEVNLKVILQTRRCKDAPSTGPDCSHDKYGQCGDSRNNFRTNRTRASRESDHNKIEHQLSTQLCAKLMKIARIEQTILYAACFACVLLRVLILFCFWLLSTAPRVGNSRRLFF